MSMSDAGEVMRSAVFATTTVGRVSPSRGPGCRGEPRLTAGPSTDGHDVKAVDTVCRGEPRLTAGPSTAEHDVTAVDERPSASIDGQPGDPS